MTEGVQRLKNWCNEQHELMSRSLAQMEKGLLHVGEGRAGGEIIDTTDAAIARTKEALAELERVMQMMRDDASGRAATGTSE